MSEPIEAGSEKKLFFLLFLGTPKFNERQRVIACQGLHFSGVTSLCHRVDSLYHRVVSLYHKVDSLYHMFAAHQVGVLAFRRRSNHKSGSI